MENDFNENEFNIDFMTAANMLDGMEYEKAKEEAIKEFKEFKQLRK